MTNLNSVSQDSLLDFHQRIFREVEEETKYNNNNKNIYEKNDDRLLVCPSKLESPHMISIDPESEFFILCVQYLLVLYLETRLSILINYSNNFFFSPIK